MGHRSGQDDMRDHANARSQDSNALGTVHGVKKSYERKTTLSRGEKKFRDIQTDTCGKGVAKRYHPAHYRETRDTSQRNPKPPNYRETRDTSQKNPKPPNYRETRDTLGSTYREMRDSCTVKRGIVVP
jgi:hypothetical protein